MSLVDSPRARSRALAVLAVGLLANLLLPWYDQYHERHVTPSGAPGDVVLVVEHGYERVRGWEMPVPVAATLALAAALALLSRACLAGRLDRVRRMRPWVALIALGHLAPVVAILVDEDALPDIGTAVAFALTIGTLLATLGTFQEPVAAGPERR